MPERRKRLTEKLKEVEQHLEGETLDGDRVEPLQNALGSVRKSIDAESNDDHDDLAEVLGDVALSFEVSHPKLTSILNQITELLAGAGI